MNILGNPATVIPNGCRIAQPIFAAAAHPDGLAVKMKHRPADRVIARRKYQHIYRVILALAC